MKAERSEWYHQAMEALEKLTAAEADVTLQPTLWEAAREDVDTDMAEIAQLQ